MRIKNFRRATRKFLLVALALILVRLALPYIGKYYINYILKDHISGYTGHIDDFDLSLWRGAYQMDDFVLQKVEAKIPTPFMSAQKIDFSIAWAFLLNGRIVGKVSIENFKVNFVNGASKKNTQTGLEGIGWQKTIDKMFPLDIEELVTHESEVHFRDFERKPEVDLFLKQLEFKATNLTNARKSQKELVSDFSLEADVQREGRLRIKGSFSLLDVPPSFDINLSGTKINLAAMNNFFKSYANFDFGQGRLDLYSEAASKKGNIKGYIKPLITHANILRANDKKDDKATGTDVLTSIVNLIVRRYSKDQVAAKIYFEGDVTDPKVALWPAIKSMFQHAFGKALEPKIDHEIDIKKVKQN